MKRAYFLLFLLFIMNCKSKREVVVAFIGNIRGERRLEYSQITDSLFMKMESFSPDYIFLMGDNIQGFSHRYMEKEWDYFFKYIKDKLNGHFYLVCGNHDVWDRDSREFYRKNVSKLHYYKDIKGIRFIVMNTSSENLREEMDWVKKVIKKRSVILMHEPLFTKNYWMDFVHPHIKGKVLYVIASDKYRYFFKEVDGVKYIITGGGGAASPLPDSLGGFNHFLLMYIRGDGVELKVVKMDTVLNERCVDPYKVVEYDRINRDCIGDAYDIGGRVIITLRSLKPSAEMDFEIGGNKYAVKGERVVYLNPMDSVIVRTHGFDFIRFPEKVRLLKRVKEVQLTPSGIMNIGIENSILKFKVVWNSDTILFSHEKPLKHDYILWVFENRDIYRFNKGSKRMAFLIVPDMENIEFIKVYPSTGMHPDVSRMKAELKRNGNENTLYLDIPFNALSMGRRFLMNVIIKSGDKMLYLSSPSITGKLAFVDLR